MSERSRPWTAVLRAMASSFVFDEPGMRARESINRLDEVLEKRGQNLAEATQRISGEL